MNDNKRLTAYCGLYCPDCIPSNQELYRKIDELEELLKELKFEKYANLKSVSEEVFKEYPTFLKVLKEMRNLECKALCTEGGCKEGCKIRKCVIDKKLEGCWECPDYKICQLLAPQKKFHNLDHNLEMIKKHGFNNWIKHRAKHYRWL